jgi:hypothetical protein
LNSNRYRLAVALAILLIVLLVGFWSCRRTKTTEGLEENETLVDQGDETLFNAIDSLNGLEEFNSVDSLREVLMRFNPDRPPKADESIDPLLVVWPQPERFRTVVDEIRQWIRSQPPPADWKLDPMVATLPKTLAELPQVKNLDKMEFTAFDGFELQEAVWLRDISLSARGDVVEHLDRVRNLFDWTVRNIQIEPDRPNRIPQLPRETLLFGRGTASERAWVFILLLRQLDIDAAVLAISQPPTLEEIVPASVSGPKSRPKSVSANSSPDKSAQSPMRPWCVGVLIEDQVYLFDPRIGLPIPAPDGVSIDESGQLVIRPATLAQVAADAKLLRRLDIDSSHPYGVKAVDPKQVTALLEAAPAYLSRPMKLIDSRLIGERKIFLTTSPTAQAERWKAAHVGESRLWLQPFETLARRLRLDWRVSAVWLRDVLPLFWVYQEQLAGGAKTSMDPLEYDETKQAKPSRAVVHIAPLFRGRILYFKGKFGEEGAARYYQIARPSYEMLAISSETDFEKRVKLQARQDATYWFGLMAFQRGRYSSAIDWLQAKTIEAYPNGPWSTGARYNLGRVYEASGKPDLAMLLYNSNVSSIGYAGDALRARWLKEMGGKRKPAGE